MEMPVPDAATIARRDEIAAVLRTIVPGDGNAGGVHCLKFGLSTKNMRALEIVLPDGEVVRLGGKHCDAEGDDLMGVLTRSVCSLGVLTEVPVLLLRRPPTARAMLIGFA